MDDGAIVNWQNGTIYTSMQMNTIENEFQFLLECTINHDERLWLSDKMRGMDSYSNHLE